MPGAMKEIIDANAGSGDPRSKFAQCIQHMGLESAKQNAKGVSDWGNKALGFIARVKDPAMEITLYLAWGINMQILKEPEQTITYYDKAKALAETEAKKNEPVYSPLLIQAVSFKAAALFQQKKLKEAAVEYELMTDYTKAFKQTNMEMEAWWQLGEVHKRMDNQPEMLNAFKAAFESGSTIDAGMLKATRYPVIAKNLYDLTEHLDYEYADEVDARMKNIMGGQWQETVSSQYIAAPIAEEEEL
jgi:tetratricopeptide (TPR) repeat protein